MKNNTMNERPQAPPHDTTTAIASALTTHDATPDTAPLTRNHKPSQTLHRMSTFCATQWWSPILLAMGAMSLFIYDNLPLLTAPNAYRAAAVVIPLLLIGFILILQGFLELVADSSRPKGSAILFPPPLPAPPVVVATIWRASRILLIGSLLFSGVTFGWMIGQQPNTVLTQTSALELLGLSLSVLSAWFFTLTYQEYPVSRLWRQVWLIGIVTTVIHACTRTGPIGPPAGPLLQAVDAMGTDLGVPWILLAFWGGLNGRSSEPAEEQERPHS